MVDCETAFNTEGSMGVKAILARAAIYSPHAHPLLNWARERLYELGTPSWKKGIRRTGRLYDALPRLPVPLPWEARTGSLGLEGIKKQYSRKTLKNNYGMAGYLLSPKKKLEK